MNYKKSLFITLLSVSVLGATTTTHAFAEQNEKTGVSAPAIPTEKANTSGIAPTSGKATTPAKQNVTITLADYVVGRSLYITGTYNNSNAVYVRAEVNGQKKTLVSSKELASGKINYYVGNLKANDKAEIVLFNKDYQEIGRQQVTIKEPVKTQITLEPYVVGRSLNITGNYNGTNAVYMRAEVNGQKKGLVSSKELTSGKISYYVGNLKATDKAEIVLFDKNYQEIGRQQVSFTEPVKTVVTLDKYVVGTSTTISGTYNGTNAVYMQAVVNGKKESLVQSKGLATGKISYYVGKLNTGDQAEIILFDKNYQEIGRQHVEIDGPAQVSMKLDNYTIGRSTNITGTYTGTDAKYIQAEVNGQKKVLVQSKELASGKINYYIGNLKAGDKVDIVLYNKDYLEIGRQQVTLVEPVPIKFTLDNYVLGDSNSITGTYDGTNAVYMQAEVNGKKEALVKSKELASGKINYYVGELKETDKAEIILFDKNYQEIGRQQVNIVKPAQVKVSLNNYDIGKSTAITGTYEGTNAVYMQAVVNGEAKDLQTSKELETGKINYNLSGLKQTDNVQLVLYNKGHQEIGRQVVPFSVNQIFYISGTTPIGSSSNSRLLISTENQHMTISNNAAIAAGSTVKMNGNFGHTKYFTLTVTGPNGESIYNKVWYGDTSVGRSGVVASFNVPNGSTVSMYHAEASGRFSTNDNAALKNKTGKTYTYKMENNRLVLVNVAQS
ncbi:MULTISPECIES: immunoglobulin-like domain-containing protein [Enterococcus]|uniref:immunoglobulin-like domain-containing protein n=1 Tax=Enterococcus TaxID=1350 RepID=UPI000A7A6EAD|nr:immunoglobulin-like domain-containing protein [Enterococcus hirae]